jgi:hypothetical protein
MKKSSKKPSAGMHYALLASLREGDVFELGVPFSFAPGHGFTWTCVGLNTESPSGIEVQLRLSYRGVTLRDVVAWLHPAKKTVDWGTIHWGDTCART